MTVRALFAPAGVQESPAASAASPRVSQNGRPSSATPATAERGSKRGSPPITSDPAPGSLPDRRRRLHLASWFASGAALTFLILVVGGITRLTQSGLSMVEWEPIVGVIPPIGEAEWERAFVRYQQFPEYQQLRVGMTLDEFRFIFFWEYLHRMLARTIGLVFLVPFVFFWIRGYFDRRQLRRAGVLFGLGALQGFAGWFMVSSGLVDQPSVSHFRLAIHLSLAFLIFGASLWFALDLARNATATEAPDVRRAIRKGLQLVGVILGVQVIWGALVAGLDAGLYSDTFPLMDGSLVPRAAFLWEPLLRDLLENPVTVQWMHRVIGTVLALAIIAFHFWFRRWNVADSIARRLDVALVGLVFGQYVLGVLTVVLHVPLMIAVAHQALAMVLFGTWLALLNRALSWETRAGNSPAM